VSGVVGRPRFSIVTAVYDVEPYLPDFIRSIERQRIDPGDLEVVAVDDGSTDGSPALLRDWVRRSRFQVKVLTKVNGGQGSARNLGLQHATAEWVTFPDPDDLLDRDFLRVAGQFAAEHAGVGVMSARPVLLYEASGVLSTSHPRRWQYTGGNRVVSLVDEPNAFLGLSSGSFFLLDRIRAGKLEFDTRIRPNFEDAHFAVRYLLALPEPRIAMLRDASYIYRKRAAGTSTLQGSMRHPGRFGAVLEHGYLDALERSRRPDGSIPAWVQQLIVYELSWYLSAEEKITTDVELPEELAPRFHELLDRILRQLDPDVVQDHRARRLRLVWLDILAHAGRDERWRQAFVVRGKHDREMRLQRVEYRFSGPLPHERFVLDGSPVEPAFAKTRSHRYFGRTMLSERIAWLPAGEHLQAYIDGVEVPASWQWSRPPGPPRTASLTQRVWLYRRQPAAYLVSRLRRRLARAARRVAIPVVRLASLAPPYRWSFRDAWVVMDRVNNADDNGERLFEHLRAERPDLNAWFVLARDSPDWPRLRATFGGRLVAWGSWRWKMLAVNCRWLISSHADKAIAEASGAVRAARRGRWKYAFLQHGVIKDDLSLWLNQRDMDLFIVSTAAELASVAGDDTGYVVTHKETRNTGLPRFDRLLAKGREVPEPERNLIIVAPTWRTRLTLPIDRATQKRDVDDSFWSSDYYLSWISVLSSPAVAAAAERRGWRIGFMPHPNIQPILGQLELPASVEPLSFAGSDVQGLYARCALLVTDYSSVAFNIAYLDRPVVYFQFDRAEMMRGGHMGRQGYFDYARDGYGPVVEDLATAEQAIVAAIARGASPGPEYQARIDAAFPNRDGGCCARVVAAIEEMSVPYGMPSG
jgi:glycosyltransferase involved in cell wall biosynthesis